MGLIEAVIPQDVKEWIEKAKVTFPVMQQRLELIEKEIHAIAYYLAHQDPDLWSESVEFAEKQIKKENIAIEKMLRRRGLR